MSEDKHFRRTLVLGLGISALLIGVGFWQSITMGIVCLVGCGALLAIFCLYTRNQTREIRRLSDYLTTLVNGTAPLLVPANNQEGELSLLENNIYKTARKLQTQAELMQKDKTYLADALADVSHQLKTPITSMTVMTDLLLEEDLPAEKRLEHMDNGGTLRLTGTQTALYCQLVIADDGCGIEKEDLPHIFERFYKGKNAGADSVGIGLALSKSVLNRENATVEVQSTVGVGTTFTIRFYRNII